MPGSDVPIAGPQYAVTDDLYDVEGFLDDVDRFCQAQNVPAGAALSEYSAGQFEINLHHVDDPVTACDHAVLLKRIIKAAARKNGMAATFMAKPFPDIAGSGLHIHVSVLDEDGNNVFAGESADGPFSDTLRHAIGGLAAAMPESMAIFAPNANSYRRYAPYSYVPCTPNWGPNHRSLALRIPLSRPDNTRVEHRVAGADANPYLVVAAVLAGIHHGISNQVEPGPMVHTGAEIEHVETLPNRWPLALQAFDQGKLLPRLPGRRIPSAVFRLPARGGSGLQRPDLQFRPRVVPARGIARERKQQLSDWVSIADRHLPGKHWRPPATHPGAGARCNGGWRR